MTRDDKIMTQDHRKMPGAAFMDHHANISRRRTLTAALGLTASLLAPPMALAEMPIDKATSFIDALGRGLMETINGTETAPAKTASLEKIIETNVDTASVARFCIGRFWRIATADQQKDYMALFHQVLVKNITGRVGDYQGVLIATNRAAAREDGIAVTTTVTRPNNAPNRVDWLVTDEGGKPQVIDVIAEGTSLRLTQRNDYLAFLSRNNGNVQTLIDALRQQAKGG
jgi:phospholipid transport system substrate-binding protein